MSEKPRRSGNKSVGSAAHRHRRLSALHNDLFVVNFQLNELVEAYYGRKASCIGERKDLYDRICRWKEWSSEVRCKIAQIDPQGRYRHPRLAVIRCECLTPSARKSGATRYDLGSATG